ncbi:MAG: phosphodiester glycosidase family protein [Haemophilus parainfluenzae]|nr:phosphodiester glycosidase family protein [Haemophilus parainfluenzae]
MKKTIKFLTTLFGSVSLLMSVSSLAEYRTFDDGNITYGIFQAKLKNALEPSYNVKMIMNAGIYSMNNTPAGLWIEHGKELNALNTKSGKGNFHVQPNGVFAIAGNKPYILTTAAYQKSKLKPDFALQSGPMLIIRGKMNPQFRASLESYHKRNAVCLTNDDKR